MTAVQEAPAVPRWRQELAQDVREAVEQTRHGWLSVRTVTATMLKAMAPHLEGAYHRGRTAHLRDVGLPVPPLKAPLAEREKEAITLAARGLSNEAIATHMFISVDTVKTHLRRVYAKTGTHDRAGAAVALLLRGEITARDVLEPRNGSR